MLVNDSKPLLELQNLSRSFTVRRGLFGDQQQLRAVDDIHLTLHAGETLGLVGESGCGKSTLGRMATGLLAPSTGHVLLEGKSLYDAAGKAHPDGRAQMVFQDPFSSLNPRLPIGLSIAEPLRIQGTPKGERQQRVSEMLELVGLLPAQAKRYPHEFSGGQRQRIAVARALITRPKLLVCDEPVSALDASVQAQVLNLLCDMQERFAPACLFISHDLAVVGFICQRIAVMYLGRCIELASKAELFAQPAHPYTQALLAAIPSHDPTQKMATTPLRGELPSPLSPPSGCTFHPRCPKAQSVCQESVPPWTQLQHGHTVRCHLYTKNEQ